MQGRESARGGPLGHFIAFEVGEPIVWGGGCIISTLCPDCNDWVLITTLLMEGRQ
jgi:hypothetical protein